MSPAQEAVLTILPPLPPFDRPILSMAMNTPLVNPVDMTAKPVSHPA